MRKRTLVAFILGLIVVAVLICYVVFIRVSYVPGGSMANTIIPGDRVVTFKSLGGAVPRGKIVLFQVPNDSNYYLGRVLGLPEETIQLRERTVYINGQPLVEEKVLVNNSDSQGPLRIVSREGSGPYSVFYDERVDPAAPPPDEAKYAVLPVAYRIPAGNYFVMGDNRDNSFDSRYHGPVPRHLIWGTAKLIYFSESPENGELRPGRLLKRLE